MVEGGVGGGGYQQAKLGSKELTYVKGDYFFREGVKQIRYLTELIVTTHPPYN